MAEPLILTTSRRKWVLVLAGCLAFVVACLVIVRGDAAVIAWIGIAFFGAGVVVAAWQVLVPGRLVVTDATVEVRHLGRRWSRDLARCSPFEVWRNPHAGQELVVFDHPDDDARRLAAVSRGLSGRSSALPDTYGMPAAELARLLNDARARARNVAP